MTGPTKYTEQTQELIKIGAVLKMAPLSKSAVYAEMEERQLPLTEAFNSAFCCVGQAGDRGMDCRSPLEVEQQRDWRFYPFDYEQDA